MVAVVVKVVFVTGGIVVVGSIVIAVTIAIAAIVSTTTTTTIVVAVCPRTKHVLLGTDAGALCLSASAQLSAMAWLPLAIRFLCLEVLAAAYTLYPVLTFEVDAKTGGYQLYLSHESRFEELWAASGGPPRLHANSKWLELVKVSKPLQSGALRNNHRVTFNYRTTDRTRPVLSTSYTDHYQGNPQLVKFEQCILADMSDTNVDPSVTIAKESIISSFHPLMHPQVPPPEDLSVTTTRCLVGWNQEPCMGSRASMCQHLAPWPGHSSS